MIDLSDDMTLTAYRAVTGDDLDRAAAAWSVLKKARGQAITPQRRARLEPAHIVAGHGLVAQLDAARMRAADRVRAMIKGEAK